MAGPEFIDVPIGPSRILAAVLITMHVAAIIAVSALPVPIWIRVAADALLLANAALVVRRHALVKGSRACSGLRICDDGDCTLKFASDRSATGRLQPGWLASPLLVVARIRCDGKRLARTILLLPDSSDADVLRRLRIFLRFAITGSRGGN
jgi:toxin CptA